MGVRWFDLTDTSLSLSLSQGLTPPEHPRCRTCASCQTFMALALPRGGARRAEVQRKVRTGITAIALAYPRRRTRAGCHAFKALVLPRSGACRAEVQRKVRTHIAGMRYIE